MSGQTGPLPVVVGVDDSQASRSAAQYAAELADALDTHLVVAHAYQLKAGIFAELKTSAEELVATVADQLHLPAGVDVSTVAELAVPSEMLTKLAGKAQVLVLGQHPAGWFAQVVEGTTALHIIDQVRCPVVIVPEGWQQSKMVGHDVIIALDGKSAARPALDLAVAAARAQRARVVALHAAKRNTSALEEGEAHALLAELLSAAREDNPDITFTSMVIAEDADQAILDMSENASLMVLSKPAYRWPGAWSSSVAHAIANRSGCPLAIAPHDPLDRASVRDRAARRPLSHRSSEIPVEDTQPPRASTAEPSKGGQIKALVVYESIWGNTEEVARAIAAGLRDSMAVEIVEVTSAPQRPDDDIELIVAGGPTHAFSMSRPSTRADAAQTRGAADNRLSTGLREWLDQLPSGRPSQSVATFDTRVDTVRHLPGSAARAAARTLHHHGYRSVGSAESFYVMDTEGPLLDGELARATAWARQLGKTVTSPA